MKTVPVLLLLLAGSPLAAQDLSYSDDATVQCLEAASDDTARRACIGAAAELCMEETDGGSTTPVMGGCLDRERSYWDDRLNASYGEAKDYAAEFDAGNGSEGALGNALVKMQRAWIPFRDSACAFEAAQWSNGTGAGPAATACLMQITAEQTLRIESAMQE
ncbi:lysozyme inhibitor LprI family protein [Sulfitobacter sp. LCG007]